MNQNYFALLGAAGSNFFEKTFRKLSGYKEPEVIVEKKPEPPPGKRIRIKRNIQLPDRASDKAQEQGNKMKYKIIVFNPCGLDEVKYSNSWLWCKARMVWLGLIRKAAAWMEIKEA